MMSMRGGVGQGSRSNLLYDHSASQEGDSQEDYATVQARTFLAGARAAPLPPPPPAEFTVPFPFHQLTQYSQYSQEQQQQQMMHQMARSEALDGISLRDQQSQSQATLPADMASQFMSTQQTIDRGQGSPPGGPKKKKSKKNIKHKDSGGRKSGASNYTNTEVKNILDIIERRLDGPTQTMSTNDWMYVAEEHKIEYPYNDRSGKSIKQKFQELVVKKKPPTGESNPPPNVMRAKLLNRRIRRNLQMADLSQESGGAAQAFHSATTMQAAGGGTPLLGSQMTQKRTPVAAAKATPSTTTSTLIESLLTTNMVNQKTAEEAPQLREEERRRERIEREEREERTTTSMFVGLAAFGMAAYAAAQTGTSFDAERAMDQFMPRPRPRPRPPRQRIAVDDHQDHLNSVSSVSVETPSVRGVTGRRLTTRRTPNEKRKEEQEERKEEEEEEDIYS